MKNDLFVFFPQWQGSGPSNDLFTAAQELRGQLPHIPFQAIPVETEGISGVESGILGYQSILSQQRAEYDCVAKAAPDRIFSLGGDCSIEIVPVSWLNRQYGGRLAVIWLDAHGDLNSPETSPSRHFHGMPLRFLLGAGGPAATDFCFSPLDPSQVLLAGVRELDAPEERFIQDSGIKGFTVDEIETDPGLLARHVIQQGLRDVYIHIDLDVLEPAEFPHLKCPTPGGMRIETLLSVIGSLKTECNAVGFSVLEYTPIQGERGRADIQRIIEAGIGDWMS